MGNNNDEGVEALAEEEINEVEPGVAIRMSPSSLRTYSNCEAGYIYRYFVLPRIDFESVRNIVSPGSKFHKIAELDFSEQAFDEILADEALKTRNEISSFIDVVKERDYFKLEARKETTLKYQLADRWYLKGIIDRLCHDGDKHIIVDYKTTGYPEPLKDLPQMFSYGVLAWRDLGIQPENIKIVIDYVREPYLFEYELDESTLVSHENWLRAMFAQVEHTTDMFIRERNVKKLTHTPTSCGFCPMQGICPAYRLVINPEVNPLEPEDISTQDMLIELSEREYVLKLYSKRVEVIKRALLEREEQGDTEVREHRTIVRPKTTIIKRDMFIKRVLPAMIKKAMRGGFSNMADSQVLENNIKDILVSLLPEVMSPKDIPQEYEGKIRDIVLTTSRSPYLRGK